IYLAVLRRDLPSPLAKESDEEKGQASEDKDKEKKDAKPTAPAPTAIDFDGIQYRIVALPAPAGEYENLQTGAPGQIYYLAALPGAREPPQFGRDHALHHYDLQKRKDDTILAPVRDFEISADHKKLLWRQRDTWGITALADKIQPGQGRLNLDALEVRIEPRA